MTRPARLGRRAVSWLLALCALATFAGAALVGCANLGYYWQSASGHLGLLRAARPVPEVLADAQTSPALKAKLELTQRIRRYAVTELHLPDNASYTGYAALARRAAVWNVVAAPPYSLALKTWCFAVVGCVGYRGYFNEADANAEAAIQRAAGLEAAVYPVPAYSTLGWMNWAGGDPLLSTFIGYPEGELARLIFHELSHQLFYLPGDTLFNESFATAVERIGGARWLATEASLEARAAYADFDARRQQFRALGLATRQRLQEVYASGAAKAHDWATVETMKQVAMTEFRDRYAALRASWPENLRVGYDAWVAGANNASFGAQAAYDQWVPAFEALFYRIDAEHPADPWPLFYAEVRRLGALPVVDRAQALLKLNPEHPNG
ncbi:MAG: aminopeptidase [Variovorax sp.]